MKPTERLRGTRQYIRTHWPTFFVLYGVLVLAVLLLGLSLSAGWYSFTLFALALIVISSYLLVATLWTAYQLYDAPGGTALDVLMGYGQTRPEDRIVCIDLGLREPAVFLAQRLTTGQVTVIDVYNPQSNLDGALRRLRGQARKPSPDPRLNWIDGGTDLLPLPDRSARAVYMTNILSEFWLAEERDRLLFEVWRILIPEGRLLIAERIRPRSSLLLAGLAGPPLPMAEYWRDRLTSTGFALRREECLRDLIYCARADKPLSTAGRQLSLKLEYL